MDHIFNIVPVPPPNSRGGASSLYLDRWRGGVFGAGLLALLVVLCKEATNRLALLLVVNISYVAALCKFCLLYRARLCCAARRLRRMEELEVGCLVQCYPPSLPQWFLCGAHDTARPIRQCQA